MFSRLPVVIACYVLSGLGALLAAWAVAMAGVGFTGSLTIVIWFFAAWAHLGMSRAWIADIRLGAAYSRRAFAAGIAALLVLPLSGLLAGAGAGMMIGLVMLEMLLMLPAIALAAYLNLFHAVAPVRGAGGHPGN